jgi:hypothetical protein
MQERDRITLGLALLVILMGVVAPMSMSISIPTFAFAVFLLFWGREGQRTETAIGRLPGGQFMLRGLRQLDLIISPRDTLLRDISPTEGWSARRPFQRCKVICCAAR